MVICAMQSVSLLRRVVSDEAIYARGVFAALNGDYEKAESYFKVVKDRIAEAADALEQISKLKK